MILFPAIDLKNGQCVRLEQGDMEVMFATLAGELASARNMSKNDLVEWLKSKIDPMIQ